MTRSSKNIWQSRQRKRRCHPDVSRYIKKFRSTTALGPTEERGVPLWVGYDIEDIDYDLSVAGLMKADDLTEDELHERGVTTFTRVAAGDRSMYEKLGIASIVD